MADKFWGTIKHLGKTYAVVGGDDAIERAKKHLGTVVAVEARADSAPLPVAELAAADAGEGNKESKSAEPPAPKDVDVSDESMGLARGKQFGGSGTKVNEKWTRVRAPKA